MKKLVWKAMEMLFRGEVSMEPRGPSTLTPSGSGFVHGSGAPDSPTESVASTAFTEATVLASQSQGLPPAHSHPALHQPPQPVVVAPPIMSRRTSFLRRGSSVGLFGGGAILPPPISTTFHHHHGSFAQPVQAVQGPASAPIAPNVATTLLSRQNTQTFGAVPLFSSAPPGLYTAGACSHGSSSSTSVSSSSSSAASFCGCPASMAALAVRIDARIISVADTALPLTDQSFELFLEELQECEKAGSTNLDIVVPTEVDLAGELALPGNWNWAFQRASVLMHSCFLKTRRLCYRTPAARLGISSIVPKHD
jgi:hypothetical protein